MRWNHLLYPMDWCKGLMPCFTDFYEFSFFPLVSMVIPYIILHELCMASWESKNICNFMQTMWNIRFSLFLQAILNKSLYSKQLFISLLRDLFWSISCFYMSSNNREEYYLYKIVVLSIYLFFLYKLQQFT